MNLDSRHSDCSEFAHIHYYKFVPISKATSLKKSHSTEDSDNEDCHEGKALSGAVVFPSSIAVEVPQFKIVFETIYDTRNNFSSPYLEPKRKPPKFA